MLQMCIIVAPVFMLCRVCRYLTWTPLIILTWRNKAILRAIIKCTPVLSVASWFCVAIEQYVGSVF